MKVQSLSDIYSSLDVQNSTVFVVPQIRFDYPDTDYLFLLYKPILNSEKFTIKSTSIFGHYKFVLKAATSKDVILHYHWLEFQDLKSILGTPWKLTCIFLFKLFGGKIIWTVHNLSPHTNRWVKLHKSLHSWMANISDKVHIHCNSVSDLISDTFNIDGKKLCLLPHPTFPATEINKESSIQFLESKFNIKLSPRKPVLLYFGNISEYKNIEASIDLIRSNNLDVQIIIAGPVKKGQEALAKRLENRNQKDQNCFLILQFIEESDIPYFFGATDFCFFNYDKILTSGSVEMALSYNKTIIAPDLGCLSDLRNNENVYLFSNEKEKIQLLKTITSTLSR